MSAIILGIKNGLKRGVPSPSKNALASSWKVFRPPTPEPQTTPIRSVFGLDSMRPDWSTASMAETMAYWVN